MEQGSWRAEALGRPRAPFGPGTVAAVRVERGPGPLPARLSLDLFLPEGGVHRWLASFVTVGRPPAADALGRVIAPLRLSAPGPGGGAFGGFEARLEAMAAAFDDACPDPVLTLVLARLPRSANRNVELSVDLRLTERLSPAFRAVEIVTHEIEPPDFARPLAALTAANPGRGAAMAARAALAVRALGRFERLLVATGDPLAPTLPDAFARVGVDCRGRLGGRRAGLGAADRAALDRGAAADPLARWSDGALNAALAVVAPGTDRPDRHLRDPFAPFEFQLLLGGHYVSPAYGAGSEIVVGAMFDLAGAASNGPRQGAALFHLGLARALLEVHPDGPTDDQIDRAACFFAMHEIAHALNLPHCFQQGPGLSRGELPEPEALSWTNYPKHWPFGAAAPAPEPGAAAFHADRWKDFMAAFWAPGVPGFSAREILHLRHAAYGEIAEQQGSLFAPP
jgi:hypothetical protein